MSRGNKGMVPVGVAHLSELCMGLSWETVIERKGSGDERELPDTEAFCKGPS